MVETLITVSLMGLVVVAVLGTLVTIARMVDHNNRVTHAGNTAQSYAEQLKQPVSGLAGDEIENMEYQPCLPGQDPVYPDLVSRAKPGESYDVTVERILHGSWDPEATHEVVWSESCPADEIGLQMLTVKVEVTRGSKTIIERVPVVKRDARCEAKYAGFDNADQGPC